MDKKLFLAQPRGFCFGVTNALQIVDEVLEEHTERPIYVFNEIVHNKTIVEELKKKSVIFTQNTDDIPINGTVIISAHGISPRTREQLMARDLTVIDATCPLVEKVHKEVLEFSAQGYHILYIGNPKHDEAKGVIDENPDNITIVQSESDIAHIPLGFEHYIVLNQTTLNLEDVNALIQSIKKKIPHLKTPPKQDICYATTSRQKIIKELGSKCDLTIVLGSQNSSNSQKLKDIVLGSGKKAVLVDSYRELESDLLREANSVCITAGASAPEYLVQEVVTLLRDEFGFTLGN